MNHIVKRKGHNEPFDERKIYASVYAACKTIGMSDGEAELLAANVVKEVVEANKNVNELSAAKLHKQVTESLQKYNQDAAYMYDTHKDIS